MAASQELRERIRRFKASVVQISSAPPLRRLRNRDWPSSFALIGQRNMSPRGWCVAETLACGPRSQVGKEPREQPGKNATLRSGRDREASVCLAMFVRAMHTLLPVRCNHRCKQAPDLGL